MSMHLAHPSLTTSGKKKGSKKYRSSDAAKQARDLDESWNRLMKKWQPLNVKGDNKINKIPVPNYRGKDEAKAPSIDTGHKGAVSIKQIPRYTGTKLIGISLEHKSRLVPVFSKEQAEDIAKMRRG